MDPNLYNTEQVAAGLIVNRKYSMQRLNRLTLLGSVLQWELMLHSEWFTASIHRSYCVFSLDAALTST